MPFSCRASIMTSNNYCSCFWGDVAKCRARDLLAEALTDCRSTKVLVYTVGRTVKNGDDTDSCSGYYCNNFRSWRLLGRVRRNHSDFRT